MTTTTLSAPTFSAALEAGVRWLYATEQPHDALVERCGVRMTTTERIVRFLPVGVDGKPLIILDARSPRWTPVGRGHVTGILPECELGSLATQLRELDVEPNHWHYHTTTGTIVLSVLAHPSLRAAIERFSTGCPWHHSQVCDAPISAGGLGCTWHTDGHNAAVWPSIPARCSDTARDIHLLRN